jgi:hypothetical protein
MRRHVLPLALLALSLPGPALAYPLYDYPTPGYPLASEPYGTPPPRSCGPTPALIGAALGGGLGALLADGSRNRRWALPLGAAFGGILGGVVSGC